MYTIGELIGQGVFGKVYRATRHGKIFAIKVVESKHESEVPYVTSYANAPGFGLIIA
jgi:serine/threonine protein kinase